MLLGGEDTPTRSWVVGAGGAVWIGCAPVTTGPPPVALADDRPNELGVAAYAGVGTDYTLLQDENRRLGEFAGYGGELWWARAFTRRVDLGLIASLGSLHGGAGGGWVRVQLNDLDAPHYVGLWVSGGYAWAQVGVPLSLGLGERVWITSRPTLTWGGAGLDHLPVGLAWRPADPLLLHLEIGGWGLIADGLIAPDPANQRSGMFTPSRYASLGVSARF